MKNKNVPRFALKFAPLNQPFALNPSVSCAVLSPSSSFLKLSPYRIPILSSTVDPIAVLTSSVGEEDFLHVIDTPELWMA